MEDPHHRQRLEVPSPFYVSNVDYRPSQRLEQICHYLLRLLVVAADEYVWRSSGELGVDHVWVTHRVKRLDDARARQPTLHLLAAGVGVPDRQLGRHLL